LARIKARGFKLSDINEISRIHKRQPELGVPSLQKVLVNCTFIDQDQGKVVGYGVLKVFAEAVLIIDKRITKASKAIALKEGMEIAIAGCKQRGIEQLYIITSFPGFAGILQKHYSAKKCAGDTLLIELGE
jgi:hypothetical protein